LLRHIDYFGVNFGSGSPFPVPHKGYRETIRTPNPTPASSVGIRPQSKPLVAADFRRPCTSTPVCEYIHLCMTIFVCIYGLMKSV
jgi:hypothetical protein